jgi:hypothetical protein
MYSKKGNGTDDIEEIKEISFSTHILITCKCFQKNMPGDLAAMGNDFLNA